MTTSAPTVTDDDDSSDSSSSCASEKAHTGEADATAAARRQLPITEVPPDTTVIGPGGPVPFGEVFEGRDDLVVYNHMLYGGESWEWLPLQGASPRSMRSVRPLPDWSRCCRLPVTCCERRISLTAGTSSR